MGAPAGMKCYFADWCGMIKAHPVLARDPVECVLETIFPHMVVPPKKGSGNTWEPPRLRDERELRKLIIKKIAEPSRKYVKKLFIDSGAYSIQAYAGSKYAESGINNRLLYSFGSHMRRQHFNEFFLDEENIQRYADLYHHTVIPTLWDVTTVFSEIDVQLVLGLDMVQGWRHELERTGYGEKILITWKDAESQSFEDWMDFAEDWPSRYAALTQYFMTPEEYLARTLACYDKGIKLHSFGDSYPLKLFDLPMYSIDSTRWKAPATWGEITLWRPIERSLWHVPTSPKKAAWKKFVKTPGRHPVRDLGLPLSTTEDGRNNPDGVEKLLRLQIQNLMSFTEDVTEWWKRKGVVYND